MHDIRELIRRAERIGIVLREVPEDAPSGIRRSLFRGQGIEFCGLREYVYGDDVRAVDWNVSARKGRPFVREFSGDRETTFYFLVDASASTRFGTTKGKDETLLGVAAGLMLATVKNRERIGLCIFTDRIECFVRARQGRSHVIRLLKELVRDSPPGGKTDLAAAFRFLGTALPRKSTLVVLSDLLCPGFEPALATLRRRHEVIVIRVVDPAEAELADTGLLVFEDPETGRQVIADTSDAGFRARYRERAGEEDRRIRAGLRKQGIRACTLESGTPVQGRLRRFLASPRAGR